MARKNLQEYGEHLQTLAPADFAAEARRVRGGGTFGLAGGILGRRAGLLEREAARRYENTAAGVFDMLDAQVESMRGMATNPEDLGIVANFDARARFARATGNLDNVDRMLELGASWLQNQETQRLAAEANAQAQLRLAEDRSAAGEVLRFNRDMELSQDLRKNVVTPYTAQMQAFNKAQQLLSTGDRIGYDFAFTMAIQALDGSVVREGERLAYTGSSGVVAQATDLFNKWKGEQTPELEAQLRRAISATHNAVVDTYQQAVGTYQSQTEAYGGDWGRVGSVVPPMDQWAAPARIAAEPEEPAGPFEQAGDVALQGAAMGAAGFNALPDTVQQGVGMAAGGAATYGAWQALKQAPAAIRSAGAALGRILTPSAFETILGGGRAAAGPVAGMGAGLGWLTMENAKDVQQLTVRRDGESPDEYRQRVYEGLQSRSDVGAFLTPDMIKVPE